MRMTYGKLIGRGAFSRVYRQGDSDTVTIVSSCYAKECQALWHECEYDRVPSLTRIDYTSDGKGIYTMPYMPRPRSLKSALLPEERELYKALRELSREVSYTTSLHDLYAIFRGYPFITNMLDSLCNYGEDIGFEISPRNVTALDGRLILLDCFFMKNQLREIRSTRRQAA